MNSNAINKALESINAIDTLTNEAVIDMFHTTNDTINKYDIMKEHATPDYTDAIFYQESVLAGVLIGAGVLGVAVSAFFIIKKILDNDKAKKSSDSSDGKAANDLAVSDPKSVETFIKRIQDAIKKGPADLSIKSYRGISSERSDEFATAFAAYIAALDEIIDAGENVTDEIIAKCNQAGQRCADIAKNLFTAPSSDSILATEALENFKNIEKISEKFAEFDNQMKKIKDLENKIKEKSKNTEANNTDETKIKSINQTTNNISQAISSILATTEQIGGAIETSIENAQEELTKKKKSEDSSKEDSSEDKASENNAGAGATENKAGTDGSKPQAQPTAGASGNDNAGVTSSTSGNPGEQIERTQQASEANANVKARNKDILYLNPNEATGKQVIPAAAEKKANEKTLEDVINMLKSGKSEEEIRGQLTQNNYNADRIDAFLTEAKNKIANERKSELLNQTLDGTKPKVLNGEVLPPETEAKPFKFPKAGDNTFNDNRREQGIDKVVENIRRLVPADSEEGSWDKIVPTLKTYGFTDDEINDYAVKNNIIPSESQGTPPPTPTDQNTDENAQKTTPEQSSENQQQTQPQQTVNQNPNGINIKDIDNIIRQASYDGISKDISESICKNVIDDISSNTAFNVANRVKDEAIKLKADQKLYFTDAAKRILRVYANAIADIEPQTDIVKKYAEDVKQASEMDLSLIEPPVLSRGSLESPKEYANKVATLIKQIPGAIPNKAKELAESEYGNSEKNDIANDIAKQLDEPEATNFRNAYAGVINGSATGNVDENQLSINGDAAAPVNTNNSVNQQDQSKYSQNSATSPQESINAINEDIMRAIENVQLSNTAKRDLFKISGESIINSIVQSIEQLGGKQAQLEQVCSMVNGTLCNRVYKLIHDAIMQDRKFLQRPVFNTMSKYGEAVTTLCSQVRDICAKMLVSYYNIPVNMVDQIVVPFENYKNDKKSVMYKWFREYDIDVIRDKKLQMLMEMNQDNKSE